PTSSPAPTPNVATPTAKPYITPDGEWSVYVNDVYGYRVRYPAAATLTERGVESFPTKELPTGMTADEYLNQLQVRYGHKLCVSIHYQLGYVNISAPPNRYGRYAYCGRTGIGDYGAVNKSETVTIEGQTYTAEGWEVIGPAQTLAYHNEFFRITLADGTEIEYGALPDETATYTDYLKMKDTLLQIVISYTKIK
ncbi:MAG: hypothetical protein ACREBU_19995, partial [Nitrososphaera sp.]